MEQRVFMQLKNKLIEAISEKENKAILKKQK
jgi:hypothetical protein